MIAHPRPRRAGRSVGPRHAHHQTRPRPVGQRVERRVIRVVSRVAIAGEVRVDQPVVNGREVFPGETEFLEQRSLVICEEDIRRGNQANQRLASFGPSQVQRYTFLVAAGENPAPVKLGLGSAGELGKEPPQVAAAGALDFDHFSAKVGHDGGGRRAGNVGSAVNHPKSREQTAVIILIAPIVGVRHVVSLQKVDAGNRQPVITL